MGPLYAAYGSWLIRENQGDYLRHFLWPNIVHYYTPDPEFLHSYNMGSDSVDEIARFWFHYKTRKLRSAGKDIPLADAFPIALALINLFFVLCLIGFAWLDGFHDASLPFRKTLRWVAFIWLANMGFSVLASSIVLRYQLFPLSFTLPFTVLLIEYILRKSTSSTPVQPLTINLEIYHQSVAVS